MWVKDKLHSYVANKMLLLSLPVQQLLRFTVAAVSVIGKSFNEMLTSQSFLQLIFLLTELLDFVVQ